jgi:hypothetical protein
MCQTKTRTGALLVQPFLSACAFLALQRVTDPRLCWGNRVKRPPLDGSTKIVAVKSGLRALKNLRRWCGDHYLFLLAILHVRCFRAAAILGISLGYVFAGPQQMAQPIPRRLLERSWYRTVQETSRKSYPFLFLRIRISTSRQRRRDVPGEWFTRKCP